jgi:hypothetical protein
MKNSMWSLLEATAQVVTLPGRAAAQNHRAFL